MSNNDRRIARRQRRDERRRGRRAMRQTGRDIDSLTDLNVLYTAAQQAAKGVRWKNATQNYLNHVLPRIVEAKRRIANGEDVTMPLKRFDLMERGKLRHIQAAKYPEKVIQKALTTHVIRPIYTPSFTAGNSANMRGRGTKYAIDRLKRQLIRHYRRHGRDGWILLTDFSDYFGSIPHEGVMKQAASMIDDPRILDLIRQLVERETGERGLGLGAEPSQVFAVAYPNRMDHWIEQQSGCEATGRYMDDIYIIDPDKQRLQTALDHIRVESARLGLTLNPRKTHIVKLSHGFTWLKKKWDLTSTGRIVIRPCRKAITRERHRLKKNARHAIEGRISAKSFTASYTAWRGSLDHIDARRTQRNMDALYRHLLNDIRQAQKEQTRT